MMQVIQNDYKGHIDSVVLTVTLVCQVGQVLAEFLQSRYKGKKKKKRSFHHIENSVKVNKELALS